MGSGFKDWSPGDVLTAADVDGYLMRQTVMTFADASARDTALSGVLDEGMMAYLEDTNVTTYYDGSSWRDIRGLGGGSATSPGGFSSGDVLDAADMNGLPAGLLGFVRTASDFTATSSGVNVGSVTGITLSSSRLIFFMCHIPLIQSRSATNYVSMFVNDDVPASASSTYLASFTMLTNNAYDRLQGYRVEALSAGTYDFYFNVFTNTA